MEEENFNSYPEELFEMASVRSKNIDDYYDRLIAVNPDINHNGNPYFKYYKNNSYGNKSGNRVARISFLRPEYVLHGKERNGIPTWKDPYPNSDDMFEIIKAENKAQEENNNKLDNFLVESVFDGVKMPACETVGERLRRIAEERKKKYDY